VTRRAQARARSTPRRPRDTRAPRETRTSRDSATRERLLDAATRLFAERGFRPVTVRDICQAARANVAAVNYHFGDKRRLYLAVIEAALEVVRKFADAATSLPPEAPPEARLRHYVRAHLVRGPDTTRARRGAVFRELFRHELSEPTGAAPELVERALGPRWRYLGGIVKELLGPAATPALVADCVLSIQAQCWMPVAAPVALTPVKLRSPTDFERIADHVVRFSLAGILARAEGGRSSSAR
jgi:TetR/AcrR family transcriptional regulator, regulator of cefoperazone and chloramphenicol sensitivity